MKKVGGVRLQYHINLSLASPHNLQRHLSEAGTPASEVDHPS